MVQARDLRAWPDDGVCSLALAGDPAGPRRQEAGGARGRGQEDRGTDQEGGRGPQDSYGSGAGGRSRSLNSPRVTTSPRSDRTVQFGSPFDDPCRIDGAAVGEIAPGARARSRRSASWSGRSIGSGIFLVPATVADNVPYMSGIVLVWVIGGLFAGAGALTLAELGAMLPQAGGLYVFLRAAYGSLPAFLFGWVEFLVVRSGSMATLAAAFARYFSQLAPPPASIPVKVWQAGAAVLAIAVVTTVNVMGAKRGGGLQVVGTALKVGGVAVLMVLPFALGAGTIANFSPVWPDGDERLDIHGHDDRDGQRALGLRRLDQCHPARRGDPRSGPQHPPRLDPGHGRADRRLSGDDPGVSLCPAHARNPIGEPGLRGFRQGHGRRLLQAPARAARASWPSRSSS